MPELKRFNGIVIYLLFNDIKHHNKPMFMFFMVSLGRRLR